jgi:fibronectin-binding autotransporter adhesin
MKTSPIFAFFWVLNDQLNATGTVNLNGATLNVNPTAAVGIGNSFTIIQASTALEGTFAGLSQGATITVGGDVFTISYGSKAVVLTRTA